MRCHAWWFRLQFIARDYGVVGMGIIMATAIGADLRAYEYRDIQGDNCSLYLETAWIPFCS